MNLKLRNDFVEMGIRDPKLSEASLKKICGQLNFVLYLIFDTQVTWQREMSKYFYLLN